MGVTGASGGKPKPSSAPSCPDRRPLPDQVSHISACQSAPTPLPLPTQPGTCTPASQPASARCRLIDSSMASSSSMISSSSVSDTAGSDNSGSTFNPTPQEQPPETLSILQGLGYSQTSCGYCAEEKGARSSRKGGRSYGYAQSATNPIKLQPSWPRLIKTIKSVLQMLGARAELQG